ncbi:uncharacterized protein B0I36DRAFT_368215 [Microdochium trichocladiopsis]|uniref:Zn(2)-C6 fungal-type domain-containing protein n=1 Tax=Microdochium trichocladiopsis TaxID=1682393 RepID=A0A9P8XU62_9PEZI|nr:uncharacterized protein B0I36DRAFT_368215 [Microdochium trichocladiopsis]KAH7018173.1 hypothetical protein B0I36DRAFT_368215 [Microdochium trichocladiopsis]
MPTSSLNRKAGAPSRRRVKSGCQTCRARKVKCDEAFPQCRRCQAGGFDCAGYGIWGGGGSSRRIKEDAVDISDTLQRAPRRVAEEKNRGLPLLMPSWVPGLSSIDESDRPLYTWFRERATLKLLHSTGHDFWAHIVLPAAHSEPLLLHACLALSSAHKRGLLSFPGTTFATTDTPAHLHTQTLQHYVKAVKHLRREANPASHDPNNGSESLQLTLIVCIVFVTIDLFRGHFQSARIHMQNGIRLLLLYQNLDYTTTEVTTLKPCRRQADFWIVQTYLSAQTQLGLLSLPECWPLVVPSETVVLPQAFKTPLESWCCLQAIFAHIFQFQRASRAAARVEPGLEGGALATGQAVQPDRLAVMALLQEQKRAIQTQLDAWLATVQASDRVLGRACETSIESAKYYSITRAYHIQACIMLARAADNGSEADDEMAYDLQHTNQLRTILEHMVGLSRMSREAMQRRRQQQQPQQRQEQNHSSNGATESSSSPSGSSASFSSVSTPSTTAPASPISLLYDHDKVQGLASAPGVFTADILHSFIDCGWIPALFFLATKCRVHRIRHQAARLLGASHHREGLWDSRITALAARKVIDLEERGFYEKIGYDPDKVAYELYELPTRYDLTLPRIPAERRFRDARLVTAGEPVEAVMLMGRGGLRSDKRTAEKWDAERCIAVYDVASQRWQDN